MIEHHRSKEGGRRRRLFLIKAATQETREKIIKFNLNGLSAEDQQRIGLAETNGELSIATPEDIQRRIKYQLEKSLTEDRDPAWIRYRQKHQDEIAKEIMDKPRKKAR